MLEIIGAFLYEKTGILLSSPKKQHNTYWKKLMKKNWLKLSHVLQIITYDIINKQKQTSLLLLADSLPLGWASSCCLVVAASQRTREDWRVWCSASVWLVSRDLGQTSGSRSVTHPPDQETMHSCTMLGLHECRDHQRKTQIDISTFKCKIPPCRLSNRLQHQITFISSGALAINRDEYFRGRSQMIHSVTL